MKNILSDKKGTSLLVRSAIWLIIGSIAVNSFIVTAAFAAKEGSRRTAIDALCATFNFSSLSGPGKPFQSVNDAQTSCQQLVKLGVNVENLRTLVDNVDFRKAFLDEIDGAQRVLFAPGKGGPATDSFCYTYSFSRLSGSGKPFQSIKDAQESCQKLVFSTMYVENLRSLLEDLTFREQFLNEIDNLNRNYVFSSPVQRIDPQITVAGTCTNPNAATLQSLVTKSAHPATQSLQENGTFDVTTTFFHYQLSQPNTCRYSVLWDFSKILVMKQASSVTKCLLGIPYPGGLTYQPNNYPGHGIYQQILTQKVPLFTMQVPLPLQSIAAQLDLTGKPLSQGVDVSSLYFRCLSSPEHP